MLLLLSWSPQHVSQKIGEYTAEGLLTASMADGPSYTDNLLVQFSGKEYDTGSCLAFAPKKNGKISENDWTPKTKEDCEKKRKNADGEVGDGCEFIKLDPWAVPCDNVWMKDNPKEWSGFSFYRAASAIEKCVGVTFTFSFQPVVALGPGLQMEFLPAPLLAVTLTICWPDKLAFGCQLSMVQFDISVAKIPLIKFTSRLIKRFAKKTTFSGSNVENTKSLSIATEFGLSSPLDDDNDKGFRMLPEGRSLLQESAAEKSATNETVKWQWMREDLAFSPVAFHSDGRIRHLFHKEGDEAAKYLGGALKSRHPASPWRKLTAIAQKSLRLFSSSTPPSFYRTTP